MHAHTLLSDIIVYMNHGVSAKIFKYPLVVEIFEPTDSILLITSTSVLQLCKLFLLKHARFFLLLCVRGSYIFLSMPKAEYLQACFVKHS